MNAGLTIATILSLLMALAGGGSADVAKKTTDPKQQLETNKENTNGGIFELGIGTTNSPSGHNLNHNETLVRDTEFKISIGGGCSPIVCGSNHNESLVRDNKFKTSIGGNCSPLVCGSNHNETLVRDVAPMK
jgi:hypothetical protein